MDDLQVVVLLLTPSSFYVIGKFRDGKIQLVREKAFPHVKR